jgi:hypothetical protein
MVRHNDRIGVIHLLRIAFRSKPTFRYLFRIIMLRLRAYWYHSSDALVLSFSILIGFEGSPVL